MQFDYRLLALAVVCLFMQLPAAATELSAAEARSALTRYIEATRSYSARFTQVLTDADGQLAEEGGGQFWLARPGQFKWLYESPWVREIVADGKQIWLYDEELDQVTTRDLADILAQTPAGLLAGNVQSLDDYVLSGSRDGGVLTIALTPLLAMGDFEKIEMRLQGDVLTALQLNDRFGQQTLITFTNASVNAALAASMFEFVVPEGADVIDETGG